jgi:hypothetical protein
VTEAHDGSDGGRVRRSGSFSVLGSVPDVVPLFITADGERAWVPGWEPAFPLADHRHERGEVWTTQGAAGRTIWVTAERRADGALFARVTPDVSAGLVDVRCYPGAPGTTEVVVEYDLTALGPAGTVALEHLARGFAAMLEDWRVAVGRALDRGGVGQTSK